MEVLPRLRLGPLQNAEATELNHSSRSDALAIATTRPTAANALTTRTASTMPIANGERPHHCSVPKRTAVTTAMAKSDFRLN